MVATRERRAKEENDATGRTDFKQFLHNHEDPARWKKEFNNPNIDVEKDVMDIQTDLKMVSKEAKEDIALVTNVEEKLKGELAIFKQKLDKGDHEVITQEKAIPKCSPAFVFPSAFQL